MISSFLLLASLITLCKDFYNRVYKLQEDKWDLELATGTKELEINELKEHVNDQRGKLYVSLFLLFISVQTLTFTLSLHYSISIVPPLKKVSKYQTQLEKMRQWTYKLAKMDMRGALKPVSKEIKLDEKLVSTFLLSLFRLDHLFPNSLSNSNL